MAAKKIDLEGLIKGYHSIKNLSESAKENPYDPELRDILSKLYGDATGHLYTGAPADTVIGDYMTKLAQKEAEIQKTVTYEDIVNSSNDPKQILKLLTSLPELSGDGEIAKAHKKYLETRTAYEGRAKMLKGDPRAYQSYVASQVGDDGPEYLANSGAEFARRVDGLGVIRAQYDLYKAIAKVRPEPEEKKK
jgi:hypothetical protein